MRIYIGTKPGNVKDYAMRDAKWRFAAPSSITCKPVGSIVPEQPWGLEETTIGAEYRASETELAVCNGRSLEPDEVCIGCENGIWTLVQSADPEKCVYIDPAVIVARTAKGVFHTVSMGIQVPTKYVLEAKEILASGDKDITVGKVIAKHLGCDHTDWHHAITHGRYSRRTILGEAFYSLLSQIPDLG